MEKINVLFLCTGNACRSQMAEGWAKKLKAEQINAYSAGIQACGLNLHTVKVMAEVGVDISGHQSKCVDTFKNVPFDFVITLCGHAHELCPAFSSNTQIIHVGFEDPPRLARAFAQKGASEEEQLNCYRKIRDEIKAFVETLPESLSKKNEKGFISRMIEQLDKKLEVKAKKTSCCGGSKNQGGSSCC